MPSRHLAPTLQSVVLGVAIILGACSASSSVSQTSTPSSVSAGPTPTLAAPSPTASRTDTATPAPTAKSVTVTIRNRSFGPSEITAAVGKITFVNDDDVPHTVSEGQNGNLAPNARFNEVVSPGQSVEIAFNQPGDYEVTCLFHSEMHLLVHIK